MCEIMNDYVKPNKENEIITIKTDEGKEVEHINTPLNMSHFMFFKKTYYCNRFTIRFYKTKGWIDWYFKDEKSCNETYQHLLNWCVTV